MSLAFVPRKLAKKQNVSSAQVVNQPTPVPPPPPPQPNASSKGKERATPSPSAEECATLFSLALSDYALWSDPELRMKLSGSDEGSAYIPLQYLLYHSPVLLPLCHVPQTLLVKNLKTLLNDVLDFRMLVAAPAPWFNPSGSSSYQKAGGYEVRQKSWDPASSPNYTKSDWEKRAVYVENVPIHYRTIPALAQFLSTLLPTTEESNTFHSSISRVQNIYLPSHHQDKPGDPPTFKGFAVVTFLREIDAQHVLKAWPWQPPSLPRTSRGTSKSASKEAGKEEEKEKESEAERDAGKFGFRTTSKAHWEGLRAEYLLYRQQLVEEINAHQDASAPAPPPAAGSSFSHKPSEQAHPPAASATSKRPRTQEPEAASQANEGSSTITLNSPYPYGCLVFIKNIHHETNRTTLKTLFGKTLSQLGSAAGGIDYVDFNKGMDTCHLRLSTPQNARSLSTHFSSSSTVQVTGLDNTGSPATGGTKPISVEVVGGTREEMYWQKVPEKVRKGAVEKAVQLQAASGNAGAGGSGSGAFVPEGDGDEGRPKKRRKR